MLNIRITRITGTGPDCGLVLEVNGQPNNGLSFATTGEEVHWIVATNAVSYISGITWKPMSGSTDVFSPNQPGPVNSQKKNWKGTVNNNADFSVYVYSIEWVKADETTPRTFDPIISIKPSTFPMHLIKTICSILGLFGSSYFIYSRMKRMKMMKTK